MTGRKKDELWKFTTRNDPSYCGGNFKCTFCGKVFAPETRIGRIRNHLAGIPNKGVGLCDKVSEEGRRLALDCDPKANTHSTSNGHLKASNGHSNIKKRKNGSSSPNSDNTQSEISDANCSSNRVDNLLANFFMSNNIDCSVADSPSFLKLLHVLCPNKYVPPSSDTLRSKLIPSVRQEFERSVARARQSPERSGSHLSGYNVTEKGSTSRHSTRSGSALPTPQYVSSLSSQEPRHIVNEEPNEEPRHSNDSTRLVDTPSSKP